MKKAPLLSAGVFVLFRVAPHAALRRAAFCLAVLVCALPVPAAAEDVVYPGATLRSIASFFGLSLAPSDGALLLPGNTVTIDGGPDISGHVLGGYSNGTDTITGNRIFIKNGTVNLSVHGGDTSGNAESNSVNISGGIVGSEVRGGYSGDVGGNALSNSISISGGTVSGQVSGGLAAVGGNAESNSITISGGRVNQGVTGGQVVAGGNALSNSVTIRGGTVNWDANGGEASFNSTGSVRFNSVTISDGAVNRDVNGGRTWGSGSVQSNTVSMSGGVVNGNVYGGYGNAGISSARSNRVTVSEGTVNGDVYGGWAGGTGNAIYNSVSLSGGRLGPLVVGGHSANGNAMFNSVNLAGAPDISRSTLYGGRAGPGRDAWTGNTLNVNGFRGAVVGIHNFQNYNFVLPSSFSPGMTLISVTGPGAVNIANTSVTLANGPLSGSGGQQFSPGQYVILIDKTSGQPANMSANPIRQGVSLLYDFSLSAGSDLRATVTDVRVNPQSKAVAEGQLASMAFVVQGADQAADQGLRAAILAPAVGGTGISSFGDFSGGSSTYHTGSHVDVSSVSLIAGLAWKPDFGFGKFLLGTFFEAGWGSYNSFNSFSNAADVHGGGDTNYYGGGLLARYETPLGLYVEGSGRIGRVRTSFSSADLRDQADGREADYETSSPYYGAHAGLGWIWKITEQAGLDIYGKYLWTHQPGQTVRVLSDPFEFEDTDSHRVRAGARFSYAVNEYIAPYTGAAYEYEFDGSMRSSVYGHKTPAPDLTGGTGMGELGLSLRPFTGKSEISFDLGVQGYVGKREGVSGNFQIKYEF